VAIYNSKHLDDLSEEIQELVISTFQYDFDLEHIAGKRNVIADYLSRNPLWDEKENETGPQVQDEFGKLVAIGQQVHVAGLHRSAQRIYDDPLLEDLRDAGCLDKSYSSVIHALRTGVTKEMVLKTTENPCRAYLAVWERLGVLDERQDSLLTLDVSRIVIPASERSRILDVITPRTPRAE